MTTEARTAEAAIPSPEAFESVADKVWAAAGRRPDAMAIDDPDGPLSYRALTEAAEAAAQDLMERGIGPEDVVAIACTRVDLCVAVLGCLRGGVAFVLVDERQPEVHTDSVLEDACPRMVMVDQRTSRRSWPVPTLDAAAGSAGARHCGGARLHPESAACIFFTSGSTGRPKGAVFSNRGLAVYADAAVGRFALDERSRFVQLARPTFDVALEELLPVWCAGGTVVFPADGLPLPEDLGATVEATATTVVELTTAYWADWLPHVESQQAKGMLESLETVIVGGEHMSPAHLGAWHATDISLIHVYGLTEATITSTSKHLDATDGTREHPPVGTAWPGSTITVAAEDGGPVLPGDTGEVLIGGPGVARCYIGRPALTAERFVPDTNGRPGARVYRTGDLGRVLPDGTLELRGRIDAQVKVRGVRIEIEHVERALLEEDAVVAAAVTTLGEGSQRRLVAVVVPRTAGDDAAQSLGTTLQASLRHRLPPAMVPNDIRTTPRLPLTAHGKIDTSRLRRLFDRPADYSPGDRELGQLEQAVAAAFAEALTTDPSALGPASDFFALGGNSLSAMRVTARLKTAYGVDVPLRELFERPTVSAVADLLEAAVHRAVAELSDEEVAEQLSAGDQSK